MDKQAVEVIPSPLGCITDSDFLARMVELRRWAGQPSLRRLRRLGGSTQALDGAVVDVLPPTTVSAVLGGRRSSKLPRLSFVEAFVTACLAACAYDVDVSDQLDRWRQAWRSLAEHTSPVPEDQIQRLAFPEPLGAPGAPVPCQLPMAVVGFAGRRRALQRLDERLARAEHERHAPAVTTITGPVGVGKTALSLQWAHRVVDRFACGQLYADLGGSRLAESVAPQVVIARFLRALGVRTVPTDADERTALYRSMLADKHMLIVLDDASSSTQVRPILPGSPTCAVIVTSRQNLRGLVVREGAQRLVLTPLSEPEAHSMLMGVLGTERTSVDEETCRALASECKGSPLALRIAAERVLRQWDSDPGRPTLGGQVRTPSRNSAR